MAGRGITVDGNGSPANPYVVTSDSAAPTPVQAGDTTTVDTTVSGTGVAGDPYVVSADVILDPAPPGGGSNLLQESPDGLFVECADVRSCLSGGDGIDYDSATGVIAVDISDDAGNTTVIGTDGGIYTPAPAGTALQVADTPTLNATVSGSGTAGDPFVVSGDVIVAPEDNGVEISPSGLLVAPSADAGNRLTFGADDRLFVPPNEVGCGLQGDGSAGSPLAAFPIAGQQPWSDDWACDPAANSTLKCDPGSGALWTPPEHYTAADHLYQQHMTPAIASMGPTGGWVVLQPGGVAAVFQFNVPANFLGNLCRRWTYQAQVHGAFDINWSSTATFEAGYIVVQDGGPSMVRPLWSLLTASGSARRERHSGSVAEALFNIAAGTARQVLFFPAVNVLTGTIGINSWTSDGTIHTTTQGT